MRMSKSELQKCEQFVNTGEHKGREAPIVQLSDGFSAITEESQNGEHVLSTAIKEGNRDLVDVLLKRGARLDECSNEMIASTLCAGFKLLQGEALCLLLKATDRPLESIVTSSGKPLLHFAAREAPEAFQTLLQVGYDANLQDPIHQETALHSACFYGNMDAIFALIQSGASVNMKNKYGETPMNKFMIICSSPEKNSSARIRYIQGHMLSRLGFKVSTNVNIKRAGGGLRLLNTYRKVQRCFDCPSLQQLCRLRLRELLPEQRLRESVGSLNIAQFVKNFLLYRPYVLDHRVLCSHISDQYLKELSLQS